MTILNKKENVEIKMFREMREKQRKAGFLDTWRGKPSKMK